MSQKREKLVRRLERAEEEIRWLHQESRRTLRREAGRRDGGKAMILAVTALAVSMAVGLTLLVRAMPVAAELDEPSSAVRTIPETAEAPEDFENAKKEPAGGILAATAEGGSWRQGIEQALYESGYFRADIPLDGDTQAFLRAACEESGVSYELALAVIWKETGYRNVVGDDGESVGYMQIQEKWHKGRMARLGVADLSDPCGNFRVGCDYLAELLEKYSLPDALTAYNRGAPGKSDYAKAVIGYLGDLEGGELQ